MRIPRKLTVLGLSIGLVALLVVASAAVANTPGVFEAESYTATFKGEDTNNHVFTTNAGTVTCKKVTYEGTAAAASSELIANPAYSECTAFTIIGAQINMESCQYKFHGGTHVAESNPVKHEGTVDIVTKSGAEKTCGEKPIKITVNLSNCVVTVGPQNGLATVAYVNEGTGTGRTVKVEANITGMTYTQNASCEGGAGTFSNGTYKGSGASEPAKVLVKGYTSKGVQQGIWVK